MPKNRTPPLGELSFDVGFTPLYRIFLFVMRMSVLTLAAGCTADDIDTLEVERWTLRVEGDLTGTSHEVRLPAHLDPWLSEHPAAFTLATDIDLPTELRGAPLELAFPSYKGIGTLLVDGEPAVRLDASTVDRHRSTKLLRFAIPAAHARSERLHVELSAPSSWAHAAWFREVPTLSVLSEHTPSHAVLVSDFNYAAGLAGFATVGFIALFAGILAVLARLRVFALFSLSSALHLVYPATVLGLTQPIFGVEELPVCAVAIVAGAITAVHVTRAYFRLPPLNRLWLMWIVAAIGMGLIVRNPWQQPYWIGPLSIVVVLANTTAQLGLVRRFVRSGKAPRNLYFLAFVWPAAAFLGVPDYVAWLGVGSLSGVEPACVGMSIIASFQAVSLLRDHTRSIRKGARLNAELGARVAELEAKQREVELLNADLKRQIAARSRQLARELTSVDTSTRRLVNQLRPGTVVDERYRIRRELGHGGMGTVYEVERIADGGTFALKVLRRAAGPTAYARFAREAQIAAHLEHEHVVSLVDFDQSRDDGLFIVMELVHGETLKLAATVPRPRAWRLDVLTQIAEGIAAIHSRGIVHRDLKPANVLISSDEATGRPHVKLTDFGVASLMVTDELRSSRRIPVEVPSAPPPTPPDAATLTAPPMATQALVLAAKQHASELATSFTLTSTGVIIGTPFYIAPELAREATSPAADVFSFGVLAFELLTGDRPFEECPLRATLDGRCLPPPPSFATARPPLGRVLVALLDRTLLRNPKDRPSAHELIQALRAELFDAESAVQWDVAGAGAPSTAIGPRSV